MKKPSLADALAKKEPPPETAPHPASAPVHQEAPKATDNRTATTLRIEPDKLEALKIIAAKKKVRVNDLILEGVAHILALNSSML